MTQLHTFISVAVSLLALALVHKANGLEFTMTPTQPRELVDKSVHFSCSLGKDMSKYKEVFVLEITKGAHTQVAVIRAGQDVITFESDQLQQRYQAKGILPTSGDLSRSFLSLTLMLPVVDDSGDYSCVVSYMDEEGIIQTDKEAVSLKVKEVGATTKYLERTVTSLLQRVESLENVNKSFEKQIKDMQSCCAKGKRRR